LDYMHLVCIGVVRKMLNVFRNGVLPYRLSRRLVSELSDRLLSFRSFTPSEFARKPRSISDLNHWKATEYRNFLLYLSPAALIGILDKSRYKHFMLLHCGIYILASDLAFDQEWLSYAHGL